VGTPRSCIYDPLPISPLVKDMDVKYKVTWQATNDFGDVYGKTVTVDSQDEARTAPRSFRGDVVKGSVKISVLYDCPHCGKTTTATRTQNLTVCDSCDCVIDY